MDVEFTVIKMILVMLLNIINPRRNVKSGEVKVLWVTNRPLTGFKLDTFQLVV